MGIVDIVKTLLTIFLRAYHKKTPYFQPEVESVFENSQSTLLYFCQCHEIIIVMMIELWAMRKGRR